MDIVCAKTGRHFGSVEAARECSYGHDRCDACPWDKGYRGSEVRFTSRGVSAATQREVDELMASINAHLKAERVKLLRTKRVGSENVKRGASIGNGGGKCVVHSPACTCADCIKKRLKEHREEKQRLKVSHFGDRGHSMTNGFVKGVIKLCLNLVILTGFVLLVKCGYQLFTTHPEDPLKGSILLILGFVAWVLIISLSKGRSRHYWLRYKGTAPNFKLTTFSVVTVLLVLTFVGVQPMASYKDSLVEGWTNLQPEADIVLEPPPIQVPGPTPVPIPKPPPTPIPVSQSYVQLFNEFRVVNGLPPLRFDPDLNSLAERRAAEISQPGNFSHRGIEGYNLGENIAMMAYSTDSNTALMELWASSPGHRANMLGSQYTRTGFARVGRYAVQLFGW